MKPIKHILLILSILAVLCSSCGSDAISSPKGRSASSSDTIYNGVDASKKKVRARQYSTAYGHGFFERPITIITVDTMYRVGDTVKIKDQIYLITH